MQVIWPTGVVDNTLGINEFARMYAQPAASPPIKAPHLESRAPSNGITTTSDYNAQSTLRHRPWTRISVDNGNDLTWSTATVACD